MAASRRFSLLFVRPRRSSRRRSCSAAASGDGALRGSAWAAFVVALAACGLASAGSLPVPGSGGGTAFAVLVGGFAAWGGVTILWSVAPDRSWASFNRGLVYFAFALVGAFAASALSFGFGALAARRRSPASLVSVGAGREGCSRAVPPLRPTRAAAHPDRLLERARAASLVFGLPLALWAATPHRRRSARVGRSLLYSRVIALVLTSRGAGIVVAALVSVPALARAGPGGAAGELRGLGAT